MQLYFWISDFKLISKPDILSISCKFALRQMPQDLTDELLSLVYAMPWCR